MKGPSEDGGDDAISEMNVIPFIDICLVLLIIILMTAAAESDLVKVELPKAENTEFRDMNLAITLSVTHAVEDNPNLKEGEKPKPALDEKGNKKYQFFFEEEKKAVEPKNLWTFLKNVQGDNKWSMLVIRTQKDTPFEYLALAFQCAQALGIEDISLAIKGNEDTEAGAVAAK